MQSLEPELLACSLNQVPLSWAYKIQPYGLCKMGFGVPEKVGIFPIVFVVSWSMDAAEAHGNS